MALTKVIGNGLGATQEGAITFNEGSADADFRVESNGQTHMLFVDGGNNSVGIGSSTPDSGRKLHIEGNDTTVGLTLKDTAGSQFGIFSDGGSFVIKSDSTASEYVRVDSTGAMTKPSQPAFSAGRSSTLSNFATNSQVVINLNSELFDVNGDFSDPNFTAPVTGKYQLSAVWYLNALDISAAYYILRISTSNRNYDHVVDSSARDEDETYSSYGISVLADMDVNDTAQISLFQQDGAAQTDVTGGTYFTGVLVC